MDLALQKLAALEALRQTALAGKLRDGLLAQWQKQSRRPVRP